MKNSVRDALLFGLSALLLWSATATAYDEGFEYQVLDAPQPTVNPDKVEVVELFWYGCPHCYSFEPELRAWLEAKPDHVEFVRIPAIFRDSWLLHARAYYTAEALGVVDKIHGPMFDALHKDKRQLNTPEAIRALFAQHGVAPEEFDKVFGSFVVQSKVKRAISMTRRYGINGVPSMIVNGKFRTDAKTASINDPRGPRHDNMLKVVDFLVAQEHAKKAPRAAQ